MLLLHRGSGVVVHHHQPLGADHLRRDRRPVQIRVLVAVLLPLIRLEERVIQFPRDNHGVILIPVLSVLIAPIRHLSLKIRKLAVKYLFHLLSALFFRHMLLPTEPPAVFALKFFLDCFKFFLVEQRPRECSRPAAADDKPVGQTGVPPANLIGKPFSIILLDLWSIRLSLHPLGRAVARPRHTGGFPHAVKSWL